MRPAAAIVLGCALALAAGAARAAVLPDLIVTPAWLLAHRGEVQVLDARPAAAYAAGHLPHAASLPEGRLRAEADPARLPGLARLRALLEGAGVRAGRPVVVYDDGSLKDAARVFWVLELLGHPEVAVLSGGTAAWLAAGGPLERGAARPGRGRFVPALRAARIATRVDVRLALNDPSSLIVDARPPAAYEGRISAGPRAGHVPGAVNVPYRAHLDAEGRLLDRAGLRRLYGHRLRGVRRVYVYCDRGRESAVAYLALRLLGVDAAVYHGGWGDWSRAPGLPVATGPEPRP